jgi:bifunctional DNA-binding transcriptional regulator/antitoxin component of YhaV-PrlF toxin-antitoxin module
MTCLKSGSRGEITLPENLRARHGIASDTPIRVIETRNGILLVPLTKEPISPALAQELEEWQSLAATSWEKFDYLNDAP